MSLTIKQSIKKYVLLKINSEQWSLGYIIPSETALSLKFNCSRITIRSSLQTFVSAGILHPIKGIGYEVISRPEMFFDSITHIYNIDKTKIEEIDKESFGEILDWFQENVSSEFIGNNIEVGKYWKKYFYTQGKLRVAQVSIINQNICWGIDDSKMHKSLTKALSSNGITPTRVDRKVFFSSCPFLSKYFKELGFPHESALLEISRLSNEEGWIEISVRVISKDLINIKNTQAIIV